MSEEVDIQIEELRDYRERHFKLAREMIEAYGGSIYPLDILAVAALNRSVNLLVGFCDLIESENFISAAPLIRLQLDNCLRFSAAWLVDDPHEFAVSVLEGTHVRNMEDRDGNRMYDGYLVEKLSEDYPWMPDVYENTSGYVHLSEKHIFNSMKVDEEEEGVSRTISKVSVGDDFIPAGTYLEATEAFQEITDAFLHLIRSWTYTKNNPSATESGDGGFSDKSENT